MDVNANTIVASDTISSLNGASENTSNPLLGLVIQSHPNPTRVGEIAWLESQHLDWTLSRNTPEFCVSGELLTQPIADPYISRSAIVLRSIAGGQLEIDPRDTSTRVRVAGEPISQPVSLDKASLQNGVTIELNSRICLLIKYMTRASHSVSTDTMIGVSQQLQQVVKQLEHLRLVDEPVLVRGATGVGKELVAQALVTQSKRSDKPFISVNLSAIPGELAAAELFGVHKGAFTGADKSRAGYFQAADGGTLFLDEIGESTPDIQAMLLRVLETGEIYPVGSNQALKVDVRVIAATDADLQQLANEKRFKLPLLHRLAGYEIYLPELHERREDIGPLVCHFAYQTTQQLNDANTPVYGSQMDKPWIPSHVMAQIVNYDWPGNIRQLRNIVRQIVINSQGCEQLQLSESIASQLSHFDSQCQDTTSAAIEPPISNPRRKPNTVSKTELETVLQQQLWQLQAAADHLNISRASVYELITRYQIRSQLDCTEAQLRASYDKHNGHIETMVFDLKMSKHAIRRRLNEYGIKQSESA